MSVKNIFTIVVLWASIVSCLYGESICCRIFDEKLPLVEEKFQKIKKSLDERRSFLQTCLTMGYDNILEGELLQVEMWRLVFEQCHDVIIGVQKLDSSKTANDWIKCSYTVAQWFDKLRH